MSTRTKTILVMHSGKAGAKAVPEDLTLVYDLWSSIGKKNGFSIMRSSQHDFDGDHFSHVWEYNNGWRQHKKKILPTVVYDKTRLYDARSGTFSTETYLMREAVAKKTRVLNDPFFSRLLSNKAFHPIVFSGHMPATTIREPGEVIKNAKSTPLVLKEFYGSGGSFVRILKQKKVRLSDYAVQQEFIAATKEGSLRDTRIVFINDEPQYAFHRLAPKGELRTNIHLGATIEYIDLRSIKRLVAHAKKVAEPLAVFQKKVFSLDFLIHTRSQTPYLIEANAMPILAGIDQKILSAFLTRLSKMLLSS